jgi:hypothetical protein
MQGKDRLTKGTAMMSFEMERRLGRMAGACFLIVIALATASCASSGPARQTAQATQQEPVKLRYYGGPKDPMYPE